MINFEMTPNGGRTSGKKIARKVSNINQTVVFVIYKVKTKLQHYMKIFDALNETNDINYVSIYS